MELKKEVRDLLRKEFGFDGENSKYCRFRLPNAVAFVEALCAESVSAENEARGTDRAYQPLSADVAAMIDDWLSDNHGRGLLICGTTGCGKTLLLDCIRFFLKNYAGLRYFISRQTIEQYMSEPSDAKALMIDDLGREPKITTQSYGNVSSPIDLLFDKVEREGVLLLATSNLKPVSDDRNERTIASVYGDRIWSRIKNNMKVIYISGKDLRFT